MTKTQKARGLVQLSAPLPEHFRPIQVGKALKHADIRADDQDARLVEVSRGVLASAPRAARSLELKAVNRAFQSREMQPNQRTRQVMVRGRSRRNARCFGDEAI